MTKEEQINNEANTVYPDWETINGKSRQKLYAGIEKGAFIRGAKYGYDLAQSLLSEKESLIVELTNKVVEQDKEIESWKAIAQNVSKNLA